MANQPSQTPSTIVHVVVLTLSGLSIIYLAFLCIYLLFGFKVEDSAALQSITHSGDTIIGALVALLINTRTNDQPVAAKPEVSAFPTAVNDQITDSVTQQKPKI
jgi:hypothetical protein